MKKIKFLLLLLFAISFKAYSFVGGGIVTPPPCVSGYIRETTNICVLDESQHNPVQNIINSGITPLQCTLSANAITSNGTPLPIGLKGIIVSANWVLQSDTTIGYMSSTVTTYGQDSSCTKAYSVYKIGAYNPLTTAGINLASYSSSNILYTNLQGQFYYQAMSAVNGTLTFSILGYVQ